jgi:S1-C subfamily serine protease
LSRPPIYDPAHYGYGPWRDGSDEASARPEPVAEPARSDRRSLVLGIGLGGLTVAAVMLLTLALTTRPDRIETVFEVRDSGTSTVLEGDVLDIQGVLAKVQHSVVTITTDKVGLAGPFAEGAGSGIIISEDGFVLTNAHVIAGADNIAVDIFTGQTFEAKVVGTFPDDDLAVIQIENVEGLVPADLGTAETLRVGDDVVAIGNALGLGGTPSVTRGIVSAKGRVIEDRLIRLENLIQTDAAINPGNSGGPLVDATGSVVGINTAIIDDAQNIGFAISIDAAKPLIERAISGDADVTPDIAFLGVTTISLEAVDQSVRDTFGVNTGSGAFVQEVVADSPADSSGFSRGDVIVQIDRIEVESAEDVAREVRTRRPGDTVDIVIERSGSRQTLTIELAQR